MYIEVNMNTQPSEKNPRKCDIAVGQVDCCKNLVLKVWKYYLSHVWLWIVFVKWMIGKTTMRLIPSWDYCKLSSRHSKFPTYLDLRRTLVLSLEWVCQIVIFTTVQCHSAIMEISGTSKQPPNNSRTEDMVSF